MRSLLARETLGARRRRRGRPSAGSPDALEEPEEPVGFSLDLIENLQSHFPPIRGVPIRHGSCINCARWCGPTGELSRPEGPDASGRYLVTGSDDLLAKLWDMGDPLAPSLKTTFRTPHSGFLFDVAVLPGSDLRSVISCGRDGKMCVTHEPGSGRAEHVELSRHPGMVHSFEFWLSEYPSGSVVLAAHEDSVVRLYDLRQRRDVALTEKHRARLRAPAASGADPWRPSLRDPSARGGAHDLLRRRHYGREWYTDPSRRQRLCWRPDPERRQSASPSDPSRRPAPCKNLALAPAHGRENPFYFTLGGDKPHLETFDLRSVQRGPVALYCPKALAALSGLEPVADGRSFAPAAVHDFYAAAENRDMLLRMARRCDLSVSSVCYDARGERLLCNLQGDQMYIYDCGAPGASAAEGRALCEAGSLGGHANHATFLKGAAFFGPDDAFAVAGDDSGMACVWHVASGSMVAGVPADSTICNGVVPHPSLPLLACYGIDPDVVIAAPRLEAPELRRGALQEAALSNALAASVMDRGAAPDRRAPASPPEERLSLLRGAIARSLASNFPDDPRTAEELTGRMLLRLLSSGELPPHLFDSDSESESDGEPGGGGGGAGPPAAAFHRWHAFRFSRAEGLRMPRHVVDRANSCRNARRAAAPLWKERAARRRARGLGPARLRGRGAAAGVWVEANCRRLSLEAARSWPEEDGDMWASIQWVLLELPYNPWLMDDAMKDSFVGSSLARLLAVDGAAKAAAEGNPLRPALKVMVRFIEEAARILGSEVAEAAGHRRPALSQYAKAMGATWAEAAPRIWAEYTPSD